MAEAEVDCRFQAQRMLQEAGAAATGGSVMAATAAGAAEEAAGAWVAEAWAVVMAAVMHKCLLPGTM